jgi:hypothetical protein
MKNVFSLFAFLFLLISCESKKQPDLPEVAQGIDTIELPKKNIELPPLSQEAQQAVSGWQSYMELERDLKRINRGSFNDIEMETERLSTISDSLMNDAPEILMTPSITSRMRGLSNRIKLLDELVNRRRIDSATVAESIEETNNAFKNLVVQINERFERIKLEEITKTQETPEPEARQKDTGNPVLKSGKP